MRKVRPHTPGGEALSSRACAFVLSRARWANWRLDVMALLSLLLLVLPYYHCYRSLASQREPDTLK